MKNKIAFFSFLLFAFTILYAFMNTNYAYADNDKVYYGERSISGTVSLPQGIVAPKGGLNFSVWAHGKSDFKTIMITIPEGKNSLAYNIRVKAGSDYAVYYYIPAISGYESKGYYNSTLGTVKTEEFAGHIDVILNDASNINLVIQKGSTLYGNITLPKGDIAPNGGLIVTVKAENAKNTQSKSFTIEEGQNSVQYSMNVIPDDGYTLSYFIPAKFTYESVGYYSEHKGVRLDYKDDEMRTTNKKELATKLNLANDRGNINLSLLKGKTLSGSVYLPNNRLAPADGLNLYLYLKSSTDNQSIPLTIEEGKNSVNYSFIAANVQDYTLQYSISPNFGYLTKGYYNILGTRIDENSATILNLYTEGKSDVNLALISTKAIAGTLSLPNGDAAPKGGIDISIYATNNDSMLYSTNVTIPEGKASVDYVIGVPKDKDYKVSYVLKNDYGYIKNCYYAGGGMSTANKAALKPVDVIDENTKDNIDMTLIKGKKISGTITLPEGDKAPAGGLNFKVWAESSNSLYYGDVNIGEGKTSGEYSIYIPANDRYKIYYDMPSKYGYSIIGYYGKGITTDKNNTDDLKYLDMEFEDKSNLNLTVLKGRKISGTIHLPDGKTAPKNGLPIKVKVYNDKYSVTKDVVVPEGSSQADYFFYVTPANGYKINYFILSDYKEYVSNSYYSNDTVRNELAASPIDLDDDDNKNSNDHKEKLDADVTLLLNNELSGVVVLPNKELAPVGGLSIYINVINGTNNYRTLVKIPEGKNSINYSLYVAPSEDCKIYYSFYGEGYVSEGYFADKGTMTKEKDLTLVDMSKGDLNNVNLTLIKTQ